MAQDDARVAQAARAFVQALDVLDREGGDAGMVVNKRRQELEAAVHAEADPVEVPA